MTAVTALASLAVVAWVLVIGCLADFSTAEARTAFALGILAVTGPYVLLPGREGGRG